MQTFKHLPELAILAQNHPESFKTMPETDIRELELQYCHNGLTLPDAYHEFLQLAGNGHPFELDDLGEGLLALQGLSKREITATGHTIDRPFIVVDVYESEYTVCFTDTSEADPEMYKIDPYAAMEGTPLIVPLHMRFSELIQEKITQWIIVH